MGNTFMIPRGDACRDLLKWEYYKLDERFPKMEVHLYNKFTPM